MRHADDGSNAKVFPPAAEKARNHPNLHLLGFTASPKFTTARLYMLQVSFSFLGCSKSGFFWASISLRFLIHIMFKKNQFLEPSRGVGTPLRPLFLCFSWFFLRFPLFFFVFFFVFLCFSMIFFVFLCFSVALVYVNMNIIELQGPRVPICPFPLEIGHRHCQISSIGRCPVAGWVTPKRAGGNLGFRV